MGARGNSGVILSQIVRGAAEELVSRPGELVDPVLVAAAFASAADAAYDSVRDPAEGTMLTVIREMAHAVAQELAHMERPRLDYKATDAEQDELLAAVLEKATRAGEEAVERTHRAARRAQQGRGRRRRRVRDRPDPGRGRRRAARRGRHAAGARPSRAGTDHAPPPRRQPLPLLHELHRHRQRARAAHLRAEARGDRRLGAGGRRPGDAEGPRPHRRARGGRGAVRGRRDRAAARRRRHARADRRPRGAPHSAAGPHRRRRGRRRRRDQGAVRGARARTSSTAGRP